MSDYKQTTVNGSQWQRCSAIYIQNSYGRTPTITIQEEQITIVGNEQFSRGAGGLNFEFDPAAEIRLLSPVTGEPLGQTMTFEALYIALWSLYMQKALERDAALAAQAG